MKTVGTLRDLNFMTPALRNITQMARAMRHPMRRLRSIFPYNISDVYACSTCDKVLLRYTEFGGYYVDHRVRELDARLMD